MKATKALLLFTISILVVSCFESPQFPARPKIQFRDLYFGLAPTPDRQDSLVVELTFEDGNGDLGLAPEHRNPPFHEYNVFLSDGTQITATLESVYDSPDSKNAFVSVPEGATGKLLRFGDQPSAEDDCNLYRNVNLWVRNTDSRIFDDTYNPDDSLGHWFLTGKFRVEPNPHHHNLHAIFFEPKDGGFSRFDWPGCETFNGRFTTLVDNDRPLSGTIRYTMSSFGFQNIMGSKDQGPDPVWQVKFVVFDRALNKSDTVSTTFALDQITK